MEKTAGDSHKPFELRSSCEISRPVLAIILSIWERIILPDTKLVSLSILLSDFGEIMCRRRIEHFNIWIIFIPTFYHLIEEKEVQISLCETKIASKS